MIGFWILIFILSLILLVKGADWFVESSEKIALALKISPFIVGVTIVAVGTSFPELASSIAAVLKGETAIVVATVVGSNIANILLIVGLSAIAARILVVRRSLIDLDAPLLVSSVILFSFIIWDGEVVFWEGVLLSLGFLTYFLYTLFQRREEVITPELVEILPEGITIKILPSRVERRREKIKKEETEKIKTETILFLVLGILGLIVGSNYAIESMAKIGNFFKIPSSLIAALALAIGTSLPETLVSVRAALKKKYEMALGNIFGSNVFNLLLIPGVCALIQPLVVDSLVISVCLPFLLLTTFIFVISGISRRIYIWEGMMYCLIYLLFVLKLFKVV